jgi:hypothetical protein
MKNIVRGSLIVVGLAVLGIVSYSARGEQGDKKVETRVFELRTYHAAPGKMKALHDRFRNHTNKLLQKYDMTLIGFWTPIDPAQAESTLIYIVAHASKEAAQKNWAKFQADPDWKTAKAASEKDGKLVDKVESVFLNPTDYSPLK